MSDDFDEVSEPMRLFRDWLREAEAAEPGDPNAMALATVDPEGLPDVRMVLLKAVGEDGFVFYTNRESAKGRQLLANPRVALCFHWKSLRRQVRVRGSVSPIDERTADAYFASRSRSSRIGAWASQQSRPLESRLALERAVAFHAARFGIGAIPRPEYWSGFRVRPLAIEFWRDGAFRIHDRVVFGREGEGWVKTRLYP